MSWEPITRCTECGDPFDVYRAPDERVCDACKELMIPARDRANQHARMVTMNEHDSTSPSTLAEALPREITRVRGIQEHYKALRGMPNVIVEPQIALMEAEIQAAIRACAEGDVVAMARLYQSLKEYQE